MKRGFLSLPLLFAAEQACAASGVLCFPGMPWCNSADLGLAWVLIVVALQLAFLYLVQGGPGTFLGHFAGHDENFASAHFGVVQVGLPIALVLSFPALGGLVLIDKWLRPVGLLEIAVVQGLYCLWLTRWRWQTDAPAVESNPTDHDALSRMHEAQVSAAPSDNGFIGIAAPVAIERSSIDAGVAAILPRAALDGIPLFPGAGRPQGRPPVAAAPAGGSATLAHPDRAYAGSAPSFRSPDEPPRRLGHPDNKAVIDRLTSIYMWDDIAAGHAFTFARKLSPGQLLSADDRARYGEALIDAMHGVARHTIAMYRYGVDTTTFATILSSCCVDGFDEYSADLMQRLTYSVLFERQKLFIDQTDIEIFGEDFIVCLYRLALYEAQSATFRLPTAGALQGAAGYPVLQ